MTVTLIVRRRDAEPESIPLSVVAEHILFPWSVLVDTETIEWWDLKLNEETETALSAPCMGTA